MGCLFGKGTPSCAALLNTLIGKLSTKNLLREDQSQDKIYVFILSIEERLIDESLHDVLRSPDNGVSVKVLGWVEPEIELLLSVSFPLSKDIGVKNIRLPCLVT